MKRLLVTCFLVLVGCSRESTPKMPLVANPNTEVTVDAAWVDSVLIDRTLPIVGTLFARDSALVSAEVEGRVEKTLAEFGDRVKAGQELALVDTDTYIALANLARARVEQARSAAVAADHELKRQQALGRGGVASTSDLEAAQSVSDQAYASVRALEAGEAVARLNLERSHIRAPFDAAVADRLGSTGDFVKSGSPLYRLVNDSVLKLIVQAPESFAPQVIKGLPVVFTVDAYPGRRFEGRVFLVSPQVTLTSRMFDFGALVSNEDRLLKAGTFARGELILAGGSPRYWSQWKR